MTRGLSRARPRRRDRDLLGRTHPVQGYGIGDRRALVHGKSRDPVRDDGALRERVDPDAASGVVERRALG